MVLALGSLRGWLTRDTILALVPILGAARAFENPARAALLPRLVPATLIVVALWTYRFPELRRFELAGL